MEKEGFVSLWIGLDKNEAELQKYVTLVYTDEGEWLPSQFLVDFEIDMDEIDEPFIERVFHENQVTLLSDLIAGCSYEEIVIPSFKSIMGNQLPPDINSAILVYNFDYSVDKKDVTGNGYMYKYIGSIQFE